MYNYVCSCVVREGRDTVRCVFRRVCRQALASVQCSAQRSRGEQSVSSRRHAVGASLSPPERSAEPSVAHCDANSLFLP